MLAYAIILVAGLVYAAAIGRWWYMSPKQLFPRRERQARARYESKYPDRTEPAVRSREGSHD